MKVLVVGATGATGNDLVQLLLADETVQQVTVFVRRDGFMEHEKLTTHVIDFDKPDEWKALLQGDVLFSCLGTTLKQAGGKAAQWKIDYDYQYKFAEVAKKNDVPQYVLVSAINASPSSLSFYGKMKGELEEAVKQLNFPILTIFRPPFLIRENSKRKMETFGLKCVTFLNRLGMFRSQRPVSTKMLAASMLNSAKEQRPGIHCIKGQEIADFTTKRS